MKKIISLLVALLTLAACSDTLNEGSTPSNKNGVEDGGITLTINLPDFTKEELTRAGEKGLTSLNAVAYDNDKNFLFNQKITSWEVVSNGYKVKVPVRNKATMIQLVANAGDLSDTQCQSGLDKAAISGTINKENPVCWGMISVSDLMKENPEISLLRQFAKVNVKYEKTTSSDFNDDKTFELESFQLYDAANKGTIAPKDFDYNAAAVNVPADAGKANSGWQTGETPFYETAAGQAYLIVKGKYHSVESFYKVSFLTDNDMTKPMALLRNHAYTVKITHVNTYGWPTEAEAIKDPYPENRMRVDVKDDNPLVTDMIACKDYHLGVSDQVSGAWDEENINATVVTTIKNGETPTFSTSDGWIKKDVTINKTGTVPDGPNSTTGKKYEISIAVEKNEYSEEPRTGKVIVKSGDLTRTITVTQKGKDFKLADDRKVKLVPITSTNVGTTDEYNDYFNKFLLNTLGIKPEDMQKEKVRNDGLHFGVGTNEFSYLIPKKVGDVVTKGTYGDKFNITDNGDRYWKVTLNSGADNYEIWTGDFTITYQENGHDIAIKYPVYHCGLFHKIDASNQQPPVDQSPVSGRFYYGVVKVKGKSKTYVMLDRNLGASSDRCYAPGTKALEANKGAIGGYFHIAKEKQNQTDAGNIINNLPQGFTIPENSVFQDIIDGGNLKEETRYTLSGEAYNSVEIITTDNSALPVIYLPATGYVEGEAFRNVTHVSLWTRTLLSGNQGFDTTSPEYGFWYRYLDVYGKICTMSNLRFVSGNAGKNTGTYRAMPLRLVHVL